MVPLLFTTFSKSAAAGVISCGAHVVINAAIQQIKQHIETKATEKKATEIWLKEIPTEKKESSPDLNQMSFEIDSSGEILFSELFSTAIK